jgi:acyl carrier protein phosphodiesterase
LNYLAHAYLSFDIPEILVGNLISDFVKGKKQYDYLPGIQKGISLHRAIDGFTDSHPATREANAIFKPYYRLYAGAFTDVVYDHFLAIDESLFTGESLLLFSERVYRQVEEYAPQCPEYFRQMFPYMKTQNWLYNYRFRRGIEKSFNGLVRRAAYIEDSTMAFELFNRHYRELQSCFTGFFPEVQAFAKQYLLSNIQNV